MTGVEQKTVAIVGLGNIGSFAVDLAARNQSVDRLVLIDRDMYEPKNTSNQLVFAGEAGAKAEVQAAKARAIRPSLEVESIVDDVERLPLGKLRANLILGCLDSRRSRQVVSERAWRLGVPFVDSGVNPEFGLARTTVYCPGPEAACVECVWTDADYDAVEAEYACGVRGEDAATGGPAELGSLAAALQSFDSRSILNGSGVGYGGRQTLFDVARSRSYRSQLSRNPQCRFDHRTLIIESLREPSRLTLGDLLDHLSARSGDECELSVSGAGFVNRIRCTECPAWIAGPYLEASVRSVDCPDCGQPMRSVWPTISGLARSAAADQRDRSLVDLGLRVGDVVEVDGDYGFQLGNSVPSRVEVT